MDNNSYEFLKDAFASPLGDFIASIGKGVGEAQAALDEGSLRQTLELYNSNGDPDETDNMLQLFREIGYQPTFYTIPKTTAKAKISLTLSQHNSEVISQNKKFIPRMYAAPVNATNTNTYGLDLNASAELQFDIVPVPPSELSLVRTFPILKDANGAYFSLEKVEAILNGYTINYEINKEVLPDNPKISSIILKYPIKNLVEGETILTPNDILVIELE